MAPTPLTLTSIPPELLLQIISHLPSSASLYALSLTSHSLSSFLHSHASSICNTLIQKHHSRAASILKSHHIDGWLVPKHPSIIQAEEQWQHELTSRTASRASSPQHRGGLNMPNCCFRTDSAGSGSTAERAPRPRMSRSLHRSPPTNTIPSIVASPATRHTDLSLSLTLGLPLPFKLSRPGPHYLVFLERYSAEIIARWEMYSHPSSPDLTISDSTTFRENQFDFMLKLYCLRNWLVLCNNTFIIGEGNGIPYAHIGHESEEEKTLSKVQEFVEDIKETFGRVVSKGKAKARRVLNGMRRKKVQPSPTRRLLFGEIDTDSASSLNSELGGRTLSPLGSSSFVVVEKDCWVKGLLWFYGVGSQFGNGVYVTPLEENSCQNEEKIYTTTQNRTVEFSEKIHHQRQRSKSGWKYLSSRWKGGKKFEKLGDI